MVWIFDRWLPKPYGNPPNLQTSSVQLLSSCETVFRFFPVSSHPRPVSLCPYLSLISFFVPSEEDLETWPPRHSDKYEKQQGFKACISGAEIAHTYSYTRVEIFPLASTWRPLGALEFISNTDKYVLNHGGERSNLQLECKALDNPLAAIPVHTVQCKNAA